MNVWLGLMILMALPISERGSLAPCDQSDPSSAQVELSASTNTAYEGQIVDLHLTLRLPTRSSPYSVIIPWLETSFPTFEWILPTEEWVCQHTVPQSGSLPLRWRQQSLYAPMIRPGEFELHWQMRVLTQPENGEPIRLEAMRVESMKSKPIVIQVLPRTSVGISSAAWDLGVGSYQVKAAWQNNTVTLGDEVLLLLEVSGQEDLPSIGPPLLTSQPGWERDAYLLEPAPETWKDKGLARIFRYRVRPRRLGMQTPPGLTVQFFHPQANHLQTRRIRIPRLNVVSNIAAGITPSAKSTDPAKNLPASWQQALAAHEQETHVRLALSRTVIALPVIFVLLIVGRVIGITFFAEALTRRRWRSAARRAERQIELGMPPQETEYWRNLLTKFLTCGLQKSVDSNIESIRSAFAASPFSEKSRPLVQTMQEFEFGPKEYRREENVRSTAKQFFLEMESRT